MTDKQEAKHIAKVIKKATKEIAEIEQGKKIAKSLDQVLAELDEPEKPKRIKLTGNEKKLVQLYRTTPDLFEGYLKQAK